MTRRLFCDKIAGMNKKSTLQILKDGPMIMSGVYEIFDSSGRKIDCGDKVALCRCGASSDKPFCDGTHKKTGFSDSK